MPCTFVYVHSFRIFVLNLVLVSSWLHTSNFLTPLVVSILVYKHQTECIKTQYHSTLGKLHTQKHLRVMEQFLMGVSNVYTMYTNYMYISRVSTIVG